MGPADAPVTIEFFSDLQCPQCARYEPMVKIRPRRIRRQGATDIEHYPLKEHEHAFLASCAAEAAANQTKVLGDGRKSLQDSVDMGESACAARDSGRAGQAAGYGYDKFEKDMDSSEVQSRIAADADHAQKVGVKTVPSVVINGYNVPNSEFNEDGFRAAIKAALAKATQ